MVCCMDSLPYNVVAMTVIINWQELAVAIIAIVVGVAVVRRVWRFFVCGDSCSCEDCGKECSHRKSKK